jgi:DNA/RNA endonuclease G (NUC1)
LKIPDEYTRKIQGPNKAKPALFKVAIDAVEAASGFDLFEKVEDGVEVEK